MKKNYWVLAIVIVLLIGGYFVAPSLKSLPKESEKLAAVTADTLVQPERKPEIYGKIKSIVGNEVVIAKSDPSVDPTAEMTSAQKQKYMQSLDEADRLKLKETILSATLGDTKVIMTVGMPMITKTAQGPEAPTVNASLADLKVGGVVSVWLDQQVTDRNKAEFVKISYSQ